GLLSQAYLRKHRIESIDLNYLLANNALLRHLKYEKQEIKRVQDSQLSLMTIHHKLNRQQLELLNTKSQWLSIMIGLLTVIIILGKATSGLTILS
ncbi:MAG: hypothetical protein MI975_06865, partial [Cytophagales bacterium]|nr:hypothetical protein [Cytophagales bacterium]